MGESVDDKLRPSLSFKDKMKGFSDKLRSRALSRSRTKSPQTFAQIRSKSVDEEDMAPLGGMDEDDDESEVMISGDMAPMTVDVEYQTDEHILEMRQQSIKKLKEREVV